MDSRERVAVLARGAAALRLIGAERRALLPPPERDDPALVREIRAVESLATRLEDEVEGAAHDVGSVMARDAWLSMNLEAPDVEFLRELAEDRSAGTPYRNGPLPAPHRRALEELSELLQRYIAGDFMPPPSWFGISEPEA